MADILIIDDEDIVRHSIRTILEYEGHTIRESTTGAEGLSLARDQVPDLLITDIFMPEKDGLEVIQELHLATPTLKILAITGGGATGGLDFLAQAKAFGAKITLRKPFLREELLEAVGLALSD
ncbi:MAG: CheY-like chemotaxis protein [Candidatus Latescibacterota bacterium]